MSIPVSCKCGKSFQAKPELAGRVVKCPACQQPLQIPAAAQAGGLDDMLDDAGLTHKAAVCPSCSCQMQPGAIICIQCGYNVESGNQMKTMTDGGVELGATTTDRALARAAHELDSMDVKQDASYGSMGGALLMTLLLVGGSLVAIVLLYVGFKAVDNSANPSGAAAIVMIVGGYGMIVIGEIWIKVIAFMEGALHGVLCLVCEIYELYFIATHFGDCLFPFGMIVGGSLMVSIGMVTASMNAGPGGVSEIPMMTEYLGTWLAMQGYSHDSNASTILATS